LSSSPGPDAEPAIELSAEPAQVVDDTVDKDQTGAEPLASYKAYETVSGLK